MRALFSDALQNNPKKAKEKEKELHAKAAAGGAGGGGGGGGKPSDHYDDAWAEAQLAEGGILDDDGGGDGSKPLEVLIEEKREELKANGVKGTPVNAETLAAWKARKAERRKAEIAEKIKAETLKKKGGKGLSVLSGRELYECVPGVGPPFVVVVSVRPRFGSVVGALLRPPHARRRTASARAAPRARRGVAHIHRAPPHHHLARYEGTTRSSSSTTTTPAAPRSMRAHPRTTTTTTQARARRARAARRRRAAAETAPSSRRRRRTEQTATVVTTAPW